jgi:2-phosphoglycerate kinase
MVFDLSHDIEPMWSVFEKAFSVKKKSPQISDAYLAEARRRRVILEKRGQKEPPIIISGGASGVGF